MEYQYILVEKKDGIGRITLNRPDKLNAWMAEMREEVGAALENLAADRLVAAGDDRQRQFAPGPADGGDHRVNRRNMGQLINECFFFEFRSPVEVDLDGRLNSQRRQNVTGGPATKGIETIFIEGHAVQLGHLQPGPVVGRHGVGEGAITVKQQGFVVLQVPVSGVRHGWCYSKYFIVKRASNGIGDRFRLINGTVRPNVATEAGNGCLSRLFFLSYRQGFAG